MMLPRPTCLCLTISALLLAGYMSTVSGNSLEDLTTQPPNTLNDEINQSHTAVAQNEILLKSKDGKISANIISNTRVVINGTDDLTVINAANVDTMPTDTKPTPTFTAANYASNGDSSETSYSSVSDSSELSYSSVSDSSELSYSSVSDSSDSSSSY
nr:uncharacterized protein LOC106615428 [Bactrocera oleae]